MHVLMPMPCPWPCAYAYALAQAPRPVQSLFFGDSRAGPTLHRAAGRPSDEEGQRAAIHFVAGLRMGIEQEVVRLRATGGVVPEALIHQACGHQAEVDMSLHSMG